METKNKLKIKYNRTSTISQNGNRFELDLDSLYFMPWLLVKPWILPLPDTIQEQPDEAIGHGFDGMIVYRD